MPIYKYFGQPAKFHGKPLFHILSNLKNFGVGRIITRSSYETEDKQTDAPSFYRILWVQPLMDKESLFGSVVAEKVWLVVIDDQLDQIFPGQERR